MSAPEITAAGPDQLSTVMSIHEAAFGQADEARLIAALLADPTAAPVVSLCATHEDQLVGHILFTRARIEGSDTRAAILAPLAVRPEAQRQGIGAALIHAGFDHLAAAGTRLVFVLGDPAYYGRYGFAPAIPLGLPPAQQIPAEWHDAWRTRDLTPDAPPRATGPVRSAAALDRPKYWSE